ncbi:MAG: NAD(P)/FAD-dependent oxidoreductase [Planctomycetota bacterium]
MPGDPSPDILIIGAGAAGLAAAIFAGEPAIAGASPARIWLLDGAARPGAKILVSGGGRCNVTHHKVTADDYSGGPAPLIRNVLREFPERRTLEWMGSLGVDLKLEDSGKYFPVSDSARTVLDALLARAAAVGATLHASTRVTAIHPPTAAATTWRVDTANPDLATITARRLIVATGGLALPKSGSDGWGLDAMRDLGHTMVPTTPALVPLLLDEADGANGHRYRDLQGLTIDASLALLDPNGKRLAGETHSLLFTHFGISGPGPMDLSRHWLHREHRDLGAQLVLGHPQFRTPEQADAWLQSQSRDHAKRDVATALRELWPERLARLIAGDAAASTLANLTKVQRKRIAQQLVRLPLHVIGDRGYKHAETTAGGVDLREIDIRSMESRRHAGLHLCGEVLDVDGRIGGFSFQWAWATGWLAGRGAVRALDGV